MISPAWMVSSLGRSLEKSYNTLAEGFLGAAGAAAGGAGGGGGGARTDAWDDVRLWEAATAATG